MKAKHELSQVRARMRGFSSLVPSFGLGGVRLARYEWTCESTYPGAMGEKGSEHPAPATAPDTGDASIGDLRERLARVTLRDEHRLRRRCDRMRRGHDGAQLDALLAEIARAERTVQRRRAAVPQVSYPPQLPVSARRDDLLRAIGDNQVVIVAGETGSGKTTQLPKICLELGRGVRGAIAHTQPRRLAARTVAERIADELGVGIGEAVGYAVRFSNVSQRDTLVRLVTDGLLLAEIGHDRLLRRYDTIIVDEAHERSLNIDFLLGYLHRLLPQRPDLKLVITSATIDPGRFSAHFGDAPIVEVSGRTYPVQLATLTTSSLYSIGSSQYNRIRLPAESLGGIGDVRYRRIGTTESFGTVHFAPDTASALAELARLANDGRRSVNNLFGEGMSPKLRSLRMGFEALGLPADVFLRHHSPRLLYAASLAHNADDVLLGLDKNPDPVLGPPTDAGGVDEIADIWRERWLRPRIERTGLLDRVAAAYRADSLVGSAISSETSGVLDGIEIPTVPSPTRTVADNAATEFIERLYRSANSYADRLSPNVSPTTTPRCPLPRCPARATVTRRGSMHRCTRVCVAHAQLAGVAAQRAHPTASLRTDRRKR